VIHTDLRTPLVNTFMVYMDADYGRMAPTDWFHLGTWGNHDPVAKSGGWALHTMGILGTGRTEFAHTEPFSGEYIGPKPQPAFPLRKWVRITVYIHYQGTTGFVQAWQDGTPTHRARVAKLGEFPGTRLRTAHWGMYANGATYQGVQYNDDIRICTLDAPLADLGKEPACPMAK
jgi:hypothetical protein